MHVFDGEQIKVLIIDDNLNFRRLLRAVLQAFNMRDLREAGGATEGLNLLKDYQADLVLLDWRMEGMDGLDFVRVVRQAPDSPNPYVPIIMVSGYTEAGLVVQARDAGINEFLAKPISAKSLLSRIVSVVQNPRPFVRVKTYFGPDRRRRQTPFSGPNRRKAGQIGDARAAL